MHDQSQLFCELACKYQYNWAISLTSCIIPQTTWNNRVGLSKSIKTGKRCISRMGSKSLKFRDGTPPALVSKPVPAVDLLVA